MHLSVILNHKAKGQNWNAAFCHINGKSVDFVLVGKESYKIICVIELDDLTHDRSDRKERDEELEHLVGQVSLARISNFE